jgi:predicted transposase/invertase (TIGR01784 family)
MTSTIHQPHDKFFKQAMKDIHVAKDFFKAHLPKKILQAVDLSTLKFENHSFIDEGFKDTEADVVYSVKIGNATAYLYLLCEHQSEVDEMMSFRLLVYTVRLMELHQKQYPDDVLPIVYPLVIYAGKEPWDAPRVIYDLFGEHGELAKEVLLRPYQLIDLHRIDDVELRSRVLSGLVEFVLKYRKTRDFGILSEVLFSWLTEIEILIGGLKLSISVIKYIFSEVSQKDMNLFIMKADEYLSPTLRGEVMTLAQLFEQKGHEQGFQQGIQQGVQQGIDQGAQQEKYQLARKLLNDGMPLYKVATLVELPIDDLIAEQVE